MNNLKTGRQIANLRKGRNDWYRIENKTSDIATVYIYDEIGYFGVTASDFVRDLNTITASNIELHINTPGGDVFDAIAIYNALRDHPAKVTTIVDALAASAGSFIAQAGDTRNMNRNSQMMIHEASGLAIGNSADMRELAELLDKMSDNIASIYAARSNTPADDWRAAMKAETWYDAQEAVDAGLADAVLGSASDASNSWDLSIYSYAGRNEAPAPAPKLEDPTDPDSEIADAFCSALQEVFS